MRNFIYILREYTRGKTPSRLLAIKCSAMRARLFILFVVLFQSPALTTGALGNDALLADPSALFTQTNAQGMQTKLQLRCVKGPTTKEPYYCEVVRTENGVEMSAHAIYPKQLQSILARYWMERGEAAGSFLTQAAPTDFTWEWRFSERFMKGKQTFPSRSVTSAESRAAVWLFQTLRSWSNFGT
jgi:hypothetical protein